MADFSWKAARKKYGVVIYNFHESNLKGFLPLQIGECVHILEEYCTGSGAAREAKWYRGYSFQNRKVKGVFPASYIHLKECKVENPGIYETITPVEDEIAKEASFVLKEWNRIWKRLFVEGSPLFEIICNVMLELLGFRCQLVSNTLTNDKAWEVREQIISRIDWGNCKLGLDLVPRREGKQVEPEHCSIVELYRLHCQSVENSMGTWPRRRTMSQFKSTRSSRENKFIMMTHLLLDFKSFACNVGEESETYFSLFDSGAGEFISEKFLVRNDSKGMPLNMDKLLNNNGLFTDLNESDLEKEIYLVAQIYRRGRVLQESSGKKTPPSKYRRPWGVAVLLLKDLFRINPEEELDFTLKVQSCVDNESTFSHLHETLIKRQTMMIGKMPVIDKDKQNIGLAVSLKLFHGDLAIVKTDNPILFSKGLTIVQRIGFSDSINPGELRNDLYLTLVGSEFERGSKKAAKNVEVKVTVIDCDGCEIKSCISGGCGEDPVSTYKSCIFYHYNNPKWNDMIRVSVPIEKFTGAHVRFEFCHCSTRDKTERQLYGFSFLFLTDKDSTTAADGKHCLNIYKCDNVTKIRNYTSLPQFHDDFGDPQVMTPLPNHLPFPRSQKESFTVSTFLCSTKFTQQADLLGVLQWSSRQDCIEQSLRNLIQLKGQEVVKYLQDILDALFNMFGGNQDGRFKYSGEVFHALVHMFNLLQDSRFEKFSCVLEAYLEDNFAFLLVYRDLMLCLSEKTEQAVICAEFDKDYTITDVFQVLEHIFRFISKSCLLFKSAYGDKLESFKQLLFSVFLSFGRILSSSEAVLVEAQIKLLNELHKIFPPLLQLIKKKELAELLHQLYAKIPKELNLNLLSAKVKLIQATVNSELFVEKDSRSLILPICMSLIKRCLITKMSLSPAAETLGDILEKFKEIGVCNIEIQSLMQAQFDILMQTLLHVDDMQRQMAGGMMICCLLELLRMMKDDHYNMLMSTYPKGRPLKEFLVRILLVFRDLIKRDMFPPDWTAMMMVANHVILTAIQYVAQSLTEHFLSGSEFDSQLWSNYFDLAVAFVTQPSLQLEKFSDEKREKVKDRYQDMRVLIGLQIQTLWNGLGNHKSHFIPSMIGPFLEVTMVPETDVRKATIPIFFDMMVCEQKQKGNFNAVESEMIEKIDILITANNGDLEYRTLFNQILIDKVQTEPVLKEDGRRFVVSVTNLLERLLDYRQVIEGDENRDKRMHCTFNILNFYKDNINREEMYIRYISKLYHLHHDANNFVEAGLTLRLYAQLLRWTDNQLPENLGYPTQREMDRKEDLYLMVIDCFDRGKAWEYGIPLCKELAEVYEKKLFNYKKLSKILQREASFFNNILGGESLRQNPSYYRVAYYGMSFPPFVRNKEFIYRGDECLKLATIMSHLTTEFPSATILSTNSPPDDKTREGEAQFIQISSVKPIAVERAEFEGQDVPHEISNFYKVNEVDTFQFDRPYHRDGKDKNNEFKTLCLERRILKTSYTLPGILRWYEVTHTDIVHLTPIMVAMENMRTVSKDFEYLISRAKSSTDIYFKNLVMRLQGVISAAVGGGIPKYQEAFFSDDYTSRYPEEVTNLMDLKAIIVEQLDLMERGLKLMEKFASEGEMPLHKSLVEIFLKLRHGITDRGSPRSGRIRGDSFSTGSGSLNSTNSSNRSSITSAEAMSQDGENIYVEPGEVDSPVALFHRHPQSPSVYGSDSVLNKHPSKAKVLSSSMSSSNIGSDHPLMLRRFTSTPDTSTDPSTPPPLPQRKTSAFLSYNVPNPTSPSTAAPSRSNLNGSYDQGLAPVKEVSTDENKNTEAAPPLPPRIPPRPSIRDHPPTGDVTPTPNEATPPPIPKRTTVFRDPGRVISKEDTKM